MIYPKDVTAPKVSNPLEITKTQRTEMIAKAKTLVPNEGIEEADLTSELEQFYVESNKHYTSAQLKDIVEQVKTDFAPKVVAEEVAKEEITI